MSEVLNVVLKEKGQLDNWECDGCDVEMVSYIVEDDTSSEDVADNAFQGLKGDGRTLTALLVPILRLCVLAV